MNKSQKTVAIGAGSGVALMIASVWVLSVFLPPMAGMTGPGSRLLYALSMNAFAILPLFIMIATVGNARFLSDAIDPLKHKENRDMEIDGRVVENTLQQNFVFFVGTLALAVVISPSLTQVLTAVTVVFIVARLAFWYGYHLNPLYRAPGMAATSYLNLGLLLASIILFFL